MTILRWFEQYRCGRRGHPYPTRTVPIVSWPDEPDVAQVFCTHCGAHVGTDYTDDAGTEHAAS